MRGGGEGRAGEGGGEGRGEGGMYQHRLQQDWGGLAMPCRVSAQYPPLVSSWYGTLQWPTPAGSSACYWSPPALPLDAEGTCRQQAVHGDRTRATGTAWDSLLVCLQRGNVLLQSSELLRQGLLGRPVQRTTHTSLTLAVACVPRRSGARPSNTQAS